ncbi:MerC mercury resistance protein [Tenacibaculum litopenaei]|uniref:MerC domain-containing protein n=1 Tax=Tenacibaculum litopenaei TaxID=396016 RepID=UPI003893B2D2
MIHKLTKKSDSLGVMAGGLCLVHCIVTPLLFLIQPMANSSDDAFSWWKSMDYIFLLISLIAVFNSAKSTPKAWVKIGLWTAWLALTAAVINEKLAYFEWTEFAVYIPALSLVVLHIYNSRYCTCGGAACQSNTK